jgi:hypothetical protein
MRGLGDRALALLHMPGQMVANRKSARRDNLLKLNERELYRAVKKLL